MVNFIITVISILSISQDVCFKQFGFQFPTKAVKMCQCILSKLTAWPTGLTFKNTDPPWGEFELLANDFFSMKATFP